MQQQGRKGGRCAALGVSLLLFWRLAAVANPAPCQESLLRFLTQIYLTGSYCTCAVVHQEVVTETGRIRRHLTYTLPGLSLGQGSPLPGLSQVQARLWGSIVSGPEGHYSLSIRLYREGRETEAMVRRFNRIQPGQEFEITAGPQRRLLLRTRIPYHLTVEARNPHLRPQQRLTVKGRACFYLVSESLSEKPFLGFARLQSTRPALPCIALSPGIRLFRAPCSHRFRSGSGLRETSRRDSES